jgi:protein ImuB
VDRLGCVDVPALPLQLLLQEHPDWRRGAVAVVEEDRPQADLLYVNEAARRAGILPGQKFSVALSMSRELRAGVVSSARTTAGVRAIVTHLRRYTPDVEPHHDRPGIFWLDASGLTRLQPSLDRWARGIAAGLEEVGLQATVVVGFTRFGTYAVARSGTGVRVFATPGEESAQAHRVALRRLDLAPDALLRLRALGIATVGDFLRLPAEGLRRRFGDEVFRLHELAAGKAWAPLAPVPHEEPHEQQTDLETPDRDAGRLLFLIKRLLDTLLAQLARRSEALAELTLHLTLDDHREYTERLRPAAPTLDAVQVLGLVRLRLETLRLTAGVVELRLTAGGAATTAAQLVLFRRTRRDPEAAHRAFARLRAELGEDAVVRAVLREGHLPAARFSWEPLEAFADTVPAPQDVAPRPLVRRLYVRPQPLPSRPRYEPDGWQVRGREDGHVERLSGPYVISGGWWSREVHREYYFAETSRGELLWVYYDRQRRRFFLEGGVE